MGRLSQFDSARLARLIAQQGGVISRAQASGCRLTDSALRHRTRPGGAWQAVLPGVYLTSQGLPTARQRATAAFLYAGRALAITGPAALARYSIPAPQSELVDVLVPLECKRGGAQFARLHRTGLVPEYSSDGVVRYASPARAVADTARQLSSFPDVRAVVAAAVQRRKVTIEQLAAELSQAPVRGSAQLRAALSEVADGVRSAAEGDFRALIRRERLPQPMFNARLFVAGELLAVTDAWWPEVGLAGEVDSRQWHLSPADYERTLARGARMTACGILVIRFTPNRIRADGKAVAAEIRAALASAEARSLPPVVAVPS